MRRMGLDTKQLTPRTVLGRISWAKNHMVDPQEYYLGSKDPNSERIAHIYQGYKDGADEEQCAGFRRSAAGSGAAAEGVGGDARALSAEVPLLAGG